MSNPDTKREKYDKVRIIRLTARALAEDGQVIPGLWSRFYA